MKPDKELRYKMIRKYLTEIVEKDSDSITEECIERLDRSYRYLEIVRPMIIQDRNIREMTYQQLAIKYRVSEGQVRRIVFNYC